ncbi:MAG: SufD family Fe-S cluster assembly protein [Methanomicrobiales archaeon]|nr:SufD family Fe-S cluster assembly protein [Methanomicrobiales archaeon]NYT20988.1 SufD family Fe-S cluster assembly protein [Methanomicrobiales archaeon]
MSENIDQMLDLSEKDQERLAQTGLEVDLKNRSGSFFQVDQEIKQVASLEKGIEVLAISEALKKYDWLEEYSWKLVPKDKDQYTRYVAEQPEQNGFVVIARRGSRSVYPLQACLFLARGNVQHVHNIVIAEEGAELHIISGCASASYTKTGSHLGVTEFYIGKDARVTSTMIHNWGEEISVFPRSASVVEENGVFLSNYVCMQPVRKIQMSPVAHLKGKNSVARFSSIVVSTPGSAMDLGSVAHLSAEGASAELLTRAITTGGSIVSRGMIEGQVRSTRGHIECKGLILKDGVIHAIPEIKGDVVDTELSHEAAVGKIARDEIEYLMSRGLSEDEATATIIRGFLDVKIAGLPDVLQKQIDAAIDAAEKSGF